MAVTRVNSASISGSGTTTAVATIPGGTGILAGDLIVVSGNSNTSAHVANGASCKDSVNGTNYTTILETDLSGASSRWLQTFFFVTPVNIADGSTVTFTGQATGATASACAVDIFRGVSGTISNAAVGVTPGAGTTCAAPALGAAPAAGNLVLSFCSFSADTVVMTVASPFTSGSQKNGTTPAVATGFVLAADGSSTYGVTWTNDSSQSTAGQTVAFTAGTGAGAAAMATQHRPSKSRLLHHHGARRQQQQATFSVPAAIPGVFNAAAFSTASTPASTVTAPAQSGVQLNDLLLIWVVSQAAAMTFSVTAGSGGWNAVTAATGQNCSAQLLWKNADSTDVALSGSAGTYTVTASVSHSIAGVIVTCPGGVFDPGTPTGSGTLLSAAGTSYTVPGVTTTIPNDLLLLFCGSRWPTGATGTMTMPGGWATTVPELDTTTTTNVGVMLGTQTQSVSGATGSAVVGLANVLDDGGGLLIAVTQTAPPAITAQAGLAAAWGMRKPRTRHVGATLGFGTAGDMTDSAFLGVVGGSRLAVLQFFFGASVPASLAAAPGSLASFAGVYRCRIDFELTHYGTGGSPAGGAVTDAAALDTFIASCQAGGLDLDLTLWHEPFTKFNGQATNALNVLDYTQSIAYYGAVLRKYGIPVSFDLSNFSAAHHNTPGTDNPVTIGTQANPGLGWAACNAGSIDVVASDFYVNQEGSGAQGNLNDVSALADLFGLPFGLNEIGFAPADASAFVAADVDAFTSYVQSFVSSWVSGGGALSDLIIWATNDNASVAGMYLATSWSATTLARYQALFDGYDSGTFASPYVNATVQTSGSANAPAGLATATGAALQAGGQNARLATGTGTASQAGGQNAQLASGTGTVQQPVPADGANAQLASGTAIALQAGGQNARPATATGAAPQPVPADGANAQLASGTAIALQAGGQNAQPATATGAAFQAGGQNAQLASGTSSAQQPAGHNTQLASGTGTAQQPLPAVTANAQFATAAGTAPQAGGQNAQLAPAAGTAPQAGGQNAQLATAAGTAQQPSVTTSGSANAPAGLASGTGTGLQAGGQNTGLAAGTGLAQSPVSALGANAGLAASTGTATQAGGQNAQLASGTGTAPQAVPAVAPAAGLAAGTSTAFQAGGQNAQLASGTGTALQPSVTTSGSANAPAGLASGTGAALQAGGQNAQPASSTGTAQPPLAAATANAQLAAATGTAPQAGGQNARLAAATGTAQAGLAAVTIPAGLASGTGTAQQPAGHNTASAPGTGTAQPPVPAVAANAGLAAATGTAPQAQAGPQAALAAGTGTAPQPAGHNAQLASGAGAAPQPLAVTAVNAPAGLAAGTGTARAPALALAALAAAQAAAALAAALQPQVQAAATVVRGHVTVTLADTAGITAAVTGAAGTAAAVSRKAGTAGTVTRPAGTSTGVTETAGIQGGVS